MNNTHKSDSKTQTTEKSKKQQQPESDQLITPTASFSLNITSGKPDVDQIMYLQRTIGNRATTELLQRQSDPESSTIQRDSPGAVAIDDDDDDDDYDDEPEEEAEEIDIPALRTEMQEMGYDEFADKYGFGIVNEVLKHVLEELTTSGEEAISGDELEIIYDRISRGTYLMGFNKSTVIEASPTLKLRIEADEEVKKEAERKADEDYMMGFLENYDLSLSQNVEKYLLMAKRYYDSPPSDFDRTEELRTHLNSEKWSWILADGIETTEDVKKLLEARRELKKAEATDAKGAAPLTQVGEGVVDTTQVASQGLTIARGVELLSDIKEETSGKEMVTAGMETLFSKIVSYSFAPIGIGADLIRAFYYNKRRRDGYSSAMERAGIDKDGHTDVKPDTADDVTKIRLGRVAHYAYKKTNRAFWGTIVNATLKLVRWIAHIITLLSGGTTAVVTGAIAVSADIARALTAIGKRVKGLYKAVTGKRGAMRKKQASELVALAQSGNDDAIQTIWDVNPFDEMSASAKKAWNASKGLGIFADSTELPKPDSLEDFKESLKSGYYSNAGNINALTQALKNTMKST